jgi:hypothetical protein
MAVLEEFISTRLFEYSSFMVEMVSLVAVKGL